MTTKPEPIVMEPDAYATWLLDRYDNDPASIADVFVTFGGNPAARLVDMSRPELVLLLNAMKRLREHASGGAR
jgi:hypothetical protein